MMKGGDPITTHCRVVDHITIHNKIIRSSGIDFDEGW